MPRANNNIIIIFVLRTVASELLPSRNIRSDPKKVYRLAGRFTVQFGSDFGDDAATGSEAKDVFTFSAPWEFRLAPSPDEIPL